jgi:hypothetical protein
MTGTLNQGNLDRRCNQIVLDLSKSSIMLPEKYTMLKPSNIISGALLSETSFGIEACPSTSLAPSTTLFHVGNTA